MDQHQRALLNQYQISLLAILAMLAMMAVPVFAQSGCTGDPCVFSTPTTTSTPGNTPTPTMTPTGTITATAQPTPVPSVTPMMLPNPSYPLPTSIPSYILSLYDRDWNSLLPQPTQVPLATIETNLTISPSTMLTVNTSSAITNTIGYTFATTLIGGGQTMISDVLSYTDYISNGIVSVQGTESLTITAAPAWYAPLLPRDMAAVGWTIELLDSDTAHNFSLSTWAYLFGYMASLPFRLVRSLWMFFKYLGPVGLFLIWLFVVMLPFVLGMRILLFFREVAIRTFNFILSIIDWILKLWEAIPFVN